ncbi:MAG: PHP domain-containing protein [Candidatus Heimdallarchaeota archaeon]|nr:MAG: PHP domain-containing protein [Candidatus Heimdallarchaeota archaeon]
MARIDPKITFLFHKGFQARSTDNLKNLASVKIIPVFIGNAIGGKFFPLVRIIDYHIHTSFSDGMFSPRDMILAAAERGIQEVCITDHHSVWKPALSDIDFEDYFTTLDRIRSHLSLGTKVFIGIEVDLSSIDSFDMLREFSWDLVLFEYVFAQPEWEDRLQTVLNFKKKYPHYNLGLAHTRFTRVPESKMEYVFEKIREFEIIIELNTGYGNYMDKWFNYLDDAFWFSIGSDAHHKDSLGNTTLAINFLKERGIPLNRIVKL